MQILCLRQAPVFTSERLDAIADAIAPPGPLWGAHRTRFLGNYDANVLQLAGQVRAQPLLAHARRLQCFQLHVVHGCDND